MKTRLFLLLAGALFFGACNNKPALNNEVTATDTLTKNVITADSAATIKSSKPVAAATVSDSQFLTTAYSVGLFEIKAGKLAKRMSEDKKVKAFAEMMIEGHEAMNKGVMALLQQKGYPVPTELGGDLKDKFKDLNQWMGKDFEQRYAAVNIDGHKEAIAMFTSVSTGSRDVEVRQLAKDALPQLQKHEDSSQALLKHINTPTKW